MLHLTTWEERKMREQRNESYFADSAEDKKSIFLAQGQKIQIPPTVTHQSMYTKSIDVDRILLMKH
jgi:hypothetical protein